MRARKGFTLVETLVAMIIFTIVMLFGVTVFVYGNKRMMKAREVGYALQLAKNDLEQVKSTDYNMVLSLPVAPPAPPTTNPQTGIRYYLNRTVTNVNGPGGTYKQVAERVTWSNPSANTVAMDAIIAPKYN